MDRHMATEMENNLTPKESALVSFNPGNATLIEMRKDSARFPRLKSMPEEQAKFEMSKIVSQAFLYRGQVADMNTIQFVSSALVNELLEDRQYGASNLSLAEIQVIVKRAVLGGTDMFGISVASLYKVIMDYVKGEGHNIEKQIADARRKSDEQKLKNSIIAPMLQAYSGQLIKNQKSIKNEKV